MAERIKVIIHDTRIKGDAPWTLVNATCVVNENHTIKQILGWINVKATKYGYIDDLYVLAHGRIDEVTKQGGFGVAVGSEELNLSNVHWWKEIGGNVGHIYLLACGAAATGDGFTMCQKLARCTKALVSASDAIQYYSKGMWGIFGNSIDYGDWEGTVYTWDAAGYCIDVAYQ